MFKIIKVASHFGAPIKGTDKGPDAIIKSLKDLDSVIEIRIPKQNPEHQKGKYVRVKNLPEVKYVCLQIIKSVKKVIKQNNTPIILHGDDSSIIGIGYGLHQSLNESFGIIYLDAHGDINTPKTTISGCLYGQGLAHLIGFGHHQLLSLNMNRPAISHKNLVMIGQRNLDPGEKKLIKQKRILLYSTKQIKTDLQKVLKGVKRKFEKRGINRIYLHIDQDVVEPILSGASLCQEPNGISTQELYVIITFIRDNFNMCAVSLGNYFPSQDKNNKTIKIINNILKLIMD